MNPAARLIAFLLLFAAALPVTAQNQTVYVSTLSGAAEAPPNASTGTGSARVTVDFDTLSMRVQVSFSDLLSMTTAAHIHCCTTASSVLAGVATQLPTFSGFPSGVTFGSYDGTFDMSSASSYNPAFVTANGGSPSGAFSALTAGLNSGRAYLNIHTDEFPNTGEIRGFLNPVPEPSTWALLLAGILGMAGVIRLRRA